MDPAPPIWIPILRRRALDLVRRKEIGVWVDSAWTLGQRE